MKRIATITILAVMAMAAASSCTKELNGAVDKAEGTVSFTVRAELPDYDADTKNTLVNTVRVQWEDGDEVYVYDNAKCLGILTAGSTDEEGRVTYLSGDIDASEASYLTLAAMSDDIKPSVFTKGSEFKGSITFDLSNQALDGAPYVAYATVLNNGTSGIGATFNFATSVVRVNCTGLKASTNIDNVIIQGVNTQLKIMPSMSGDPIVTAEKGKGTIIRKEDIGLSSVNAEGTTTFSVALLGQEEASRSIYAVQDANWVTEAKFTNGGLLKSGLSYNTVTQLADAEDYVLIEAKYNNKDFTFLKWYKQNLAITDSGKKPWKGSSSNTEAVSVPGTDYAVRVGDYFQWAASYAGYGITDEDKKKPENLLIYTAFTHTLCGESQDMFTFKSPTNNYTYHFEVDDNYSGKRVGICPYPDDFNLDNPENAKYGPSKKVLEKSDDVANIILGGNWRMPTSAELVNMKKATYWAWDATDKGYYVFKPGQGTNGAANGKGNFNPDSDNKEKALLFFPAAGWGTGAQLFIEPEDRSYYLSSSVYTEYGDDFRYACGLKFWGTNNDLFIEECYRAWGFPVRPVSD